MDLKPNKIIDMKAYKKNYNKEHYDLEYFNNYYRTHKDDVIICTCGTEVKKIRKARHLKSAKHSKKLNALNNNLNIELIV